MSDDGSIMFAYIAGMWVIIISAFVVGWLTHNTAFGVVVFVVGVLAYVYITYELSKRK